MPTFEIETNGKTYEVEAPDMHSAASALGSMAPSAPQGAVDKLIGAGGQRYQTWPERLVRGVGSGIASGATLPGDVLAGKAKIPSSGAVPGSVPFGDPESSGERVADLAGLASPLNPAARAGDKAIPGVAKVLREPEAPTAEALYQSAGKGFDAAREANVAVPASGMQQLASFLEGQLQSKGIHPNHAPDAYEAIKRIRDTPSEAPLSMADIHNIRQDFGNAAANFSKPKDTLAGSMGVQLVDRVLKAIAEKGVLDRAPASGEVSSLKPYSAAEAAGPASKSLLDAIGDYAAASRSDAVTGRTDLAALRAKVSNSGQNLDNATRQRFVDIASEGKAARGFSDEEIAQALRLAEGGPATNAARFTGNLLGGGGGLGMAITSGAGAAGGAILGGPVGAGIGATVGPVLGATSKQIANVLTRREAAALDEMVRMRSPLYESNAANPGTVEGQRAGIENLVRALMEAENGHRSRERPSIIRALTQ